MNRLAYAFLGVAAIFAPMTTLTAHAGEVANREVHQENRIYNGIKNGTVDYRESRQLQRGEAQINQERIHDLKRDDGRLTARDRRDLNHDENQQSRRIFHDTHNN